MRIKKWVKIVITIIVIHISFFIWKQTGTLGELAQKDTFYMILTLVSWCYLIVGQALIYMTIWNNKKRTCNGSYKEIL